MLKKLLFPVATIGLLSAGLSFLPSVQAQQPGGLTTLQTLAGHKDQVNSLSITGDGKYLVSGSFDKVVKVWDLATGAELNSYAGKGGHTDLVLGLSLNPDATIAASAGKDNTIRFWDLPSAKPAMTFTGSTDAISTVVLSTDSSKAASAGAEKIIRLWNTADGKEVRKSEVLPAAVTKLSWALSNQLIAASLADGSIYLWNPNDGKNVGYIGAHEGVSSGVGFHTNSQLLLSAGHDGMVKGWTIPQPAVKSIDLPAAVTCFASSHDGNKQLVGLADKRVLLIDAAKPGIERTWEKLTADVVSLAIAGNTVAAGLANGSVVCWNLNDGKDLSTVPAAAKDKAVSIAVRNDGKLLYAVGTDGIIKQFDLPYKPPEAPKEATKEEAKDKDKAKDKQPPAAPAPKSVNHGASVNFIRVHPTDGNTLLSAGADKTVKLWKFNENKMERKWDGAEPATNLAFSKDGGRVAIGFGKELGVWQTADGKELAKFPHPAAIKSVSFAGDGNKVCTSADDGRTRILDASNKSVVQWFKTGAFSVAHADNQRLMEITGNKWNIQTIGASKLFKPHTAAIHAFEVIDNGNRAIIGGADGVTKAINLGGGGVDREYKGHAGPVLSVATASSKQLLFTGGSDKTLRVFQLVDGKELKNLPQAGPVQGLALNNDSSILFSATDAGAAMHQLPYTSGQPLGDTFGKITQNWEQPGARTVVSQLDGRACYFGGTDKLLRSFRVMSGNPARVLNGHGNMVDACAFSPDGQTLASCSHDGTVRLWNPADGKQTAEIKVGTSPIYCIAWRNDNKQLAIGLGDKWVRTIDVANKKVDKEIKGFDAAQQPMGHQDFVLAISYTADGQQILSAGGDGTVKVWNVADGKHLRSFVDTAVQPTGKAHKGWIYSLNVSKDGKRLVTVDYARTCCVWNVADGQLVAKYSLPTSAASCVIFPAGDKFALGLVNGQCIVAKMP